MELFNVAFFFWWDNVKFYLLYGIALIFMTMSIIEFFRPAIGLALAGRVPMAMVITQVFAVGGVVVLITYAALLTRTVKMAQGYDAGVINSTISGLLNLKSILWLIMVVDSA